MAKVRILFKIMPDEVDKGTDIIIEQIKELSLEKNFSVLDTKMEDIAFGIKAIKILISAEESAGTEDIETRITNLENVGSVDILGMTRVWKNEG